MKIIKKLDKEIKEVAELTDFFSEDSGIQKEITKDIKRIEEELKGLEFQYYLSGKYALKGAILTIHPGAGGTESCDWAAMLLRMYLRFFERKGFHYKRLDFQPGEIAGIKSATIEITNKGAYGLLEGERGVHRLVRISPFDANKRRHTSFASVFVYPSLDPVEVKINESDLKIETFRASGHGGQYVNKASTAVRITHLPTGIVVSCQDERSQYQNKQNALKVLRAKLYRREEEKREKEMSNIEKTEIAWGHQIRSYVLFPYKLIKDYRTNLERHDVENVLDGDIEDFIYVYLISRKSQI